MYSNSNFNNRKMISSMLPIALITIVFRKFWETINRPPLPPPINFGSYTPTFLIFSVAFFYFYTHTNRGTSIKFESDMCRCVKDKRHKQNRNHVHKKRLLYNSWFMQNVKSSRRNKQAAVRHVGEGFLQHFDNTKSQSNNIERTQINDPVIVAKMSGISKTDRNKKKVYQLPTRQSHSAHNYLSDNLQESDVGGQTENGSVDSSVVFSDCVPQETEEDIVKRQPIKINPASSTAAHFTSKHFRDRDMYNEKNKHVFLKRRKRSNDYYFAKRRTLGCKKSYDYCRIARTTRSGRVYGFFGAI